MHLHIFDCVHLEACLFLNIFLMVCHAGSKKLPIIVASVGGGVALLMLLVVLICTSMTRGIKASRKGV